MKNKNLDLSIIVTTHDSDETLLRCINSLNSQSFPRERYEIIIVDDGSTDKSVEIAKKNGSDLIIQTKPCTVSMARNLGVKESKSEFLAFTDSDCEVEENWVEVIIDTLSKVDAVSGPIMNGNPHSTIAWAELFMHFGGYNEKRSKGKIRFMPGCNQAMRKEAFQKAGGFTDIRASDDVMFGESLKKVGVTCYFFPEIKIRHLCRTKFSSLKKNMKLNGTYLVRTRRHYPTIKYNFLVRSKVFIPFLFLGKFFFTLKGAIETGKIFELVKAFPFIFLGLLSWCSGIALGLDEGK